MKVIPSNYKIYKDEDFPTLKNDLILQAANGNLNQQYFFNFVLKLIDRP